MTEGLPPHELEALAAEELPDREAMSTVAPPGGELDPGVVFLPATDVQDGDPWQAA